MNERRFGVSRLLSSARRLNREAALVAAAKGMRERLAGDDGHLDRLSTARGRPADLAARELAALRGDAPGLVGEVGLTALLAWQNFSEHRGRGRGEVDVAIVFTDLAGLLRAGRCRRETARRSSFCATSATRSSRRSWHAEARW